MKIAMILLARIGSKRLPEKLIKLFAGYPLIDYTLNFMNQFDYEKYVFTDSAKIKKICEKYSDIKINEKRYENREGIHYTQKELIEYNKKINADIIILLQATSPFRTKSIFANGLNVLIEKDKDVAFSCFCTDKIFYNKDGKRINERRSYNEKEYFYQETGAYYIFRKNQLLMNHITEGNKYFCQDKYDIDIDTLADFKRAEILYKNGFYNAN